MEGRESYLMRISSDGSPHTDAAICVSSMGVPKETATEGKTRMSPVLNVMNSERSAMAWSTWRVARVKVTVVGSGSASPMAARETESESSLDESSGRGSHRPGENARSRMAGGRPWAASLPGAGRRVWTAAISE